MTFFEEVSHYISDLQSKIAGYMDERLGEKLQTAKWHHKEDGGGLSMSLEGGQFFLKAAVHFSEIHATLSTEMQKTLAVNGGDYSACGVSLIFHPISPCIPTVHLNIRFFKTEDVSWFGGVCDLTPYYPHVEDFSFFHRQLKQSLDGIDPTLYQPAKEVCDDYFTLRHRNEMRGIGGIFFDYLKEDKEKDFQIVRCVGDFFLPCYFDIFNKRVSEKYTKQDLLFQSFRHGRYVEFNLLYDRGTKFGLQSGGRVESILSSLPPYPYFPNEFDYLQNPLANEMKSYYQPKSWI